VSCPAKLGKTYWYQVGHCGLQHVVDFDGSYWDLDSSTLSEEEESQFGINSDLGTIALIDRDIAVYRSSRKGEATLHRHTGAKTFGLCG
jgi:hypothetical protein